MSSTTTNVCWLSQCGAVCVKTKSTSTECSKSKFAGFFKVILHFFPRVLHFSILVRVVCRVLTSAHLDHYRANRRYDSNQSGALEPAQLTEFLTELNGQTPPTEEEISSLLGQADASKQVSADHTQVGGHEGTKSEFGRSCRYCSVNSSLNAFLWWRHYRTLCITILPTTTTQIPMIFNEKMRSRC